MTSNSKERARLSKRERSQLWRFVAPYKGQLVAAAILLVAAIVLRLSGPIFMQRAIDLGIKRGDEALVGRLGAMFVATAFAYLVVMRAAMLKMGAAGQKALKDLRVEAFTHLARQDLAYFEKERSGKLVARVTSDAEAVERLVTEDLVRLVTEVLFVLGAAALLFSFDVRLTLAALSVVPVIAIATSWFRRAGKRAYEELRERVSGVLTLLQENLRGVQVVQAFGRERFNSGRFREANFEWGDAKVGTFLLEARYFSVVEFLAAVGTAAVLIYGGMRTAKGDLSLGTLTVFVVYLSLFFDPIHHLSERFTTFQSAMAGMARIAHLLAETPQVKVSERPVAIDRFEGAIELRDVTFSYAGGPPVLQSVDLKIAAGSTVALVGPTGAGKSTIMKLIARFYDTVDGQVSIDGADIRHLDPQALKEKMALVPQEAFLFGGSILDNIKFGAPHASRDAVEAVCRQMDLWDFVSSLPEGLDTQVDQRGSRFSTGERQLIAMARALVSSPKILLLDEATSALDPGTEARVERAVQGLVQQRTSVIIAHRISTVMNADLIVVIEKGRVAEQGSHEELVARGGRYASLYDSWIAGTAAQVGVA